MFPTSKSPDTLALHKIHDLAFVLVLIIGYQQLFEHGHFFFRDDQHPRAVGDHIVVCEDHSSSFIAVPYFEFMNSEGTIYASLPRSES